MLEVGDAVAIKVSSKHQITIPSAVREKYGFTDYALCTFTEGGILIQPIEGADNSENLTVELFTYLIKQGFEGQELLDKYEEIRPKFIDYTLRVLQAEDDFESGRTTTYEAMRTNIAERYGV